MHIDEPYEEHPALLEVTARLVDVMTGEDRHVLAAYLTAAQSPEDDDHADRFGVLVSAAYDLDTLAAQLSWPGGRGTAGYM